MVLFFSHKKGEKNLIDKKEIVYMTRKFFPVIHRNIQYVGKYMDENENFCSIGYYKRRNSRVLIFLAIFQKEMVQDQKLRELVATTKENFYEHMQPFKAVLLDDYIYLYYSKTLPKVFYLNEKEKYTQYKGIVETSILNFFKECNGILREDTEDTDDE